MRKNFLCLISAQYFTWLGKQQPVMDGASLRTDSACKFFEEMTLDRQGAHSELNTLACAHWHIHSQASGSKQTDFCCSLNVCNCLNITLYRRCSIREYKCLTKIKKIMLQHKHHCNGILCARRTQLKLKGGGKKVMYFLLKSSPFAVIPRNQRVKEKQLKVKKEKKKT